MLEAGRGPLDDVELADRPPLVVAEERDDGRAEACPERGGDLGRIGADDDDVAIVDLELRLEGCEVPNLARALWSPVSPVEAHDERKPLGELRERDGSAGVIRQLEIDELSTGDEIGSHGPSLVVLVPDGANRPPRTCRHSVDARAIPGPTRRPPSDSRLRCRGARAHAFS